MERNEFFKLAQKATVYTDGFSRLNKEAPIDCIVMFQGIKYYPISIEVGFDKDGNTKNTVRLHDLKSNSVTYADLGRVDKQKEK